MNCSYSRCIFTFGKKKKTLTCDIIFCKTSVLRIRSFGALTLHDFNKNIKHRIRERIREREKNLGGNYCYDKSKTSVNCVWLNYETKRHVII